MSNAISRLIITTHFDTDKLKSTAWAETSDARLRRISLEYSFTCKNDSYLVPTSQEIIANRGYPPSTCRSVNRRGTGVGVHVVFEFAPIPCY